MRRLSSLLGVVVAVILPVLPAFAAGDDQVDSFRIAYQVTPDGVLHVTETIVYRFGPDSGRHGIFRDLLVREPYVDDQTLDQRYDVSKVTVTSPSGDSAELNQETNDLDAEGRTKVLRLRIGSGDRTVEADTATYVIRYQVRGALRHFADHSELYWDATGSQWEAQLRKVSVTVDVPGGVTKVACFAGTRGSKASCATHQLRAGRATFGQPSINTGAQLTVVAAIRAGKVRNDRPLLMPAPIPEPTETVPSDATPPEELPPGIPSNESQRDSGGATPGVLIGAGAGALVLPAGAALLGRRGRRDQRYAGLAPGAVPPDGAQAGVVRDTVRADQIPVAFAPPRIPVAEAGLLVDGKIDTEETAATLVDLAVRGAVRIDSEGDDGGPAAVLVDPERIEYPHERELLTRVFGDQLKPAATRPLGRGKAGQDALRSAHVKMVQAVESQVEFRGWFTRMPSAGSPGAAGCLPIGMTALAAAVVGWGIGQGTGRGLDGFLAALVVVVGGVSLYAAIRARARGQRSAAGRAVADQLIGFRTYLSTAEADQLRFEEGEDIFSRYLPWAIVFGIADRWRKVCAELVAAGRLPAETSWYNGPSYVESAVLLNTFSTLNSSFLAPPPAPSSSSGSSSGSSGFSGSSFDFGGGGGSSSGFSSSSSDGGSAGGGGGGGGGGSW